MVAEADIPPAPPKPLRIKRATKIDKVRIILENTPGLVSKSVFAMNGILEPHEQVATLRARGYSIICSYSVGYRLERKSA